MDIGTSASVRVTTAGASLSQARELQLARSDANTAAVSFHRKQEAELTVGFGSDSVKLPGVAATTIRRNLKQAEQLVPSVAESQARVREQTAQAQQELKRSTAPAEPRQLDFASSRTTAVQNSQQFLSTLNSAAGTALSRTSGAEQAPSNRLDIRIGESSIPFDKPQSTRVLDLRA